MPVSLDRVVRIAYSLAMTNNRTAAHITAQVAVEAIVNCEGDGMEPDTMLTVLDYAREQGVGSIYIGMLEDLIESLRDA